jgi:hypothetical protein
MHTNSIAGWASPTFEMEDSYSNQDGLESKRQHCDDEELLIIVTLNIKYADIAYIPNQHYGLNHFTYPILCQMSKLEILSKEVDCKNQQLTIEGEERGFT